MSLIGDKMMDILAIKNKEKDEALWQIVLLPAKVYEDVWDIIRGLF